MSVIVLDYDSLGCSAIQSDSAFDRPGFDMDTERLPNCPFHPLPEKYGPLIDSQALLEEARKLSGPFVGDGWSN